MNSNEKSNDKKRFITINEGNRVKLNQWIAQINLRKRVTISRKALLNWYLENAPEILPNKDINSAIESFYDPEVHLKQLRTEQASGKIDGEIEIIFRPKKSDSKRDENRDEENQEQATDSIE